MQAVQQAPMQSAGQGNMNPFWQALARNGMPQQIGVRPPMQGAQPTAPAAGQGSFFDRIYGGMSGRLAFRPSAPGQQPAPMTTQNMIGQRPPQPTGWNPFGRR
jgi:hypothetical protein